MTSTELKELKKLLNKYKKFKSRGWDKVDIKQVLDMVEKDMKDSAQLIEGIINKLESV